MGRYHDVESMLMGDCDPNSLDVAGYTPLHRALQRNFLAIATLLLVNGATVNTIDHDRYTTLLRGIETGNLEIVKRILDRGADPTGPDGAGRCPPILCAWSSGGHPMEILIQSSIGMWDYQVRGVSTNESMALASTTLLRDSRFQCFVRKVIPARSNYNYQGKRWKGRQHTRGVQIRLSSWEYIRLDVRELPLIPDHKGSLVPSQAWEERQFIH